MKRVEAIIRPDRLELVASSLEAAGLHGFTVVDVRGHGRSPARAGGYRGSSYEVHVTHKLAVTVLVDDAEVDTAVGAIVDGARTGEMGDGMITVTDVVQAVSIRGGTIEGVSAAR